MNKFLPTVFFVITFAIFIPVFGLAQNVGINADGSLPDNSAMLDVSSTKKGFLPPRMTLAERNLINLPATGIIVYQTDDIAGLYVNKGTSSVPSWQLIGPAVPAASPSFFFNSDQTVSSSNYIGLGSSSSSFIRNTLVIPMDCLLKSITFSTRGSFLFGSANTATATVWRQTPGSVAPQPTTLSATIYNDYFSVAGADLSVNAGDLISVRIISSNGSAFIEGVAVSVTYQ
jgi:hypothetical protein